MFRNPRFTGIILWLFAFQVYAFTSGGKLAENIWLDIATGVIMFTAACFVLGQGLSERDDLSYTIVMLLIAAASALISLRVYEQTPYRWYDLMTIVAAPQVVAMTAGWLLAARRDHTNDMQLDC